VRVDLRHPQCCGHRDVNSGKAATRRPQRPLQQPRRPRLRSPHRQGDPPHPPANEKESRRSRRVIFSARRPGSLRRDKQFHDENWRCGHLSPKQDVCKLMLNSLLCSRWLARGWHLSPLGTLSPLWGDLDAHDKQANELTLKAGTRIFSSYKVGEGKILGHHGGRPIKYLLAFARRLLIPTR
jgi:hypothetical protein